MTIVLYLLKNMEKYLLIFISYHLTFLSLVKVKVLYIKIYLTHISIYFKKCVEGINIL